MYQPQIIQDAFMGLVGFRQTESPDFPQLASSLLKTSNNLLVEHSLINIENIDMTARNYAAFNYPAYNSGTPYTDGTRVRASNTYVYEAIGSVPAGNEPSVSPLLWERIDLLSLHLEDVVRSSIDQVVERMFDEKKIRREVKTVLESTRAMDAIGDTNDLVVNAGALVGVEIQLAHRQNIIAVIEQIGIQLSAAQSELTFHIYHTSQAEEIATEELTLTKIGSFEWVSPGTPIMLHHLSPDYASGGRFFIMYDQDDLVGQAISAQYNFSTAPCTCNPYAYRNWTRMSKFIGIRSCYIPAVDRPASVTDMFNTAKLKYDQSTNYGLNFDVTVKCDLTQFLIRQKSLFAPAIRDMVIVKLLDQMKNSTRVNGIDAVTKQSAAFALQSRQVGGGGLIDDLNRKIKTIDFEIAALDSVCMPCAAKNGVKHSSFGLAG